MASSPPDYRPGAFAARAQIHRSPLAIKAHLCYTPVIAYDFCRERLPGVKEHMDRTVCPVRGAGGMG